MAKLIYPLTESVLEKADLKAAIKVINSKKTGFFSYTLINCITFNN